MHATAASRRHASLTHSSREELRDEMQVARWLASRDLKPCTGTSAAQKLEELRARLHAKRI